MRIVSFVSTDAVILYPFEGIGAFGRTVLYEGQIVGEYFGEASEEDLPTWEGTWPLTRAEYKVSLTSGEVLQLLGATAYSAIYAVAYPSDGSSADPQALFFLESAKNPYSPDGLLIVNISPVTDAMAYFVYKGYIAQADADRIIQGQPYEVEL